MKSVIITVTILFLIFLLALAIRMDATKYGELSEFDPFWNYKATAYLVDNGWQSYKEWKDMDSWYPFGRDVSATSQEGLHMVTAFLYNFYDGDLYNFVILIPAIYGALSIFPMYVIVSQLSKSRYAGLVAGLFYSVTLAILIRNSAGWFKSEPLGLLLGLTVCALVTFLFMKKDLKINKIIPLSVITGLLVTLSLSSWIGSAILIFPILIYGLIFPVFSKETKSIGQIITIIGLSSLLPMMLFERAESLFLPFSFVLIGVGLYVWFSHRLNRKLKIIIIVAVMSALVLGLAFSDVSDRYKSSMLPFINVDDKLVQSVAEHQLPTLEQIFYLQGFYVFLAPIGLVMYWKSKSIQPIDKIWMITLVGTLMYFGMSVIRLQLIFSVAMIILSAIGSVLIIQALFKSKKDRYIKSLCFMVLMSLTITPFMILWIDLADTPPSILNGATVYSKSTNEWLSAMDFIKNLEPDAKIFAWWDYGYWISVLGERATYMDNSTLYTWLIVWYAEILASTPEQGYAELIEFDVDYILVYSTTIKQDDKISFAVGGDEYKSQWIFKIANKTHDNLNNDFFRNTLLGSLLPFEYIDGEPVMKIKQSDNFELVYMSESYKRNEDGIRYGILIYKVLK